MSRNMSTLPSPLGERTDRRLWRSKGGERVAAVKKSEESVSPNNFFGTATGWMPDRREGKKPSTSGRVPEGGRGKTLCMQK